MGAPINYETSIPQPAKIVVIEDNAAVNEWLSEKLNNLEHLELVGSIGTYNGAFEMIKKEKPEFIILDLKLPDGNGLDILKNIRKAKMLSTVIVLTLNAQAKNISFRVGADYFFDKSKDAPSFLEKLKSINNSIRLSSEN